MQYEFTQPPTSAGCGLVVYRGGGEFDAIDQYSRRLVAALRVAGEYVGYTSDGLSYSHVRALAPSWVLLQYNPFSYGRWGFAPGLVRDALRLRGEKPPQLALLVHEAWVGMRDWRSTLMGAYQRAQLMSLVRLADTVIVTTERLTNEVGNRAVHIPVASTIVPLPVSRQAARQSLGIRDQLVVGLFGTAHPSRDHSYSEAAIRELAEHHSANRVIILNLGAGAPTPDVPAAVAVRTPGALGPRELSLHLRASDLLLLPLKDGLSTRRTTMMAGLAHGVPVVGLQSAHTDRILVEHPEALRLVTVGDRQGYAAAAVALTADVNRLHAMGEAARLLYERAFDWPIAANSVASAIYGTRRSTTVA
ncbi:MAG: hypothetical protein WKF96_03890 [Solirubrobacteraceae bacterium]